MGVSYMRIEFCMKDCILLYVLFNFLVAFKAVILLKFNTSKANLISSVVRSL